MNFFGLNITRQKSMRADHHTNGWSSNRGGWSSIVGDWYPGAWQKNDELKVEDRLTYHAVFACITLIASDISKLGIDLHSLNKGIWSPIKDNKPALVLDNPNNYQSREQFFETWLLSKLTRGNAYIIKERQGKEVIKLHVLHPDRVKPYITDNGEVYYQVGQDSLIGLSEDLPLLPASEIIHDKFNCIYHPLVGLSPICAASLAISQGHSIQKNSATFFGNNSNPGGILTAPGAIADDTATRLAEQWKNRKAGNIAVLGDGLKYESMSVTASDSQLIEQLRWTAEVVCSVFHVPKYMIGVENEPSGSNVQALTQRYYNQCLQRLIKDIQSLLNNGFNIPKEQGFRFNLDSLLMMDTHTQMGVLKDGVGAGIIAPNEARLQLNKKAVKGGETPLIQQQNYSLEALAKRDAQANPFNPNEAQQQEAKTVQFLKLIKKGLTND